MTCTRPDVAYALSLVSRYQADPGDKHWKVTKTILKYLKNTKNKCLIYGDREMKLEGFTNSIFQSDCDDIKSVSGYIFTLYGGAVSWKSSKHQMVANFVTEAEYIAAKEAVWMRKFLTELGEVPDANGPVTLHCDNTGAIAQAKEPRSHHRSKHVLRRFHLIREIMNRGDIILNKIDGKKNLADPMTKALGTREFSTYVDQMGIKYRSDWL